MEVKDLRIGDMVTTKSMIYDCGRIVGIDNENNVSLKYDEYNTYDFSVLDIHGVKADKNILTRIGGDYNPITVEHVFTFRGGLRIAIRPQMGTENYTASVIGQYRSTYCKFTYIHTFQHWLWDKFKIEI